MNTVNDRKRWSTQITSGCEELIRSTLQCRRLVYVEQSPDEPVDQVKLILDYSGVDAFAIHDKKKHSALSFRVTNYDRPQVTIRASELPQWMERQAYIQPDYHIQLSRPRGQNHIHCMTVVDVNEFRDLVAADQYLTEVALNDGTGSFYRLNAEGFSLPCIKTFTF